MVSWSTVGTLKIPQICPQSSEYTQKESGSDGQFSLTYTVPALVYMTQFLRKKNLILSGIIGNPDQNSFNDLNEFHFLLALFPTL